MKKKWALLAAVGMQCFLAGLPAMAASSGSPASTSAAVPGDPEVRSSSALVLDVTRSAVLYARNENKALPIASITKLMTALVVTDAGQPLDERIEITKADVAHTKGVYSRLPAGAKLTRGELMHLALMSSENRAAHALGRTYPGGLTAFVRAMNAKAKALGMTRSHFADPSGLSPENVASPRDLVKLVLAAAKNPVIRLYSTDPEHTVRVGQQMLQYRNTNTLTSNPTWDITVQKTGYLSAAGRCLVMQANIDGRSVVIVLLNAFGKYTRVADARRIRRWMESHSAATNADATEVTTDATTSGTALQPASANTRS